MGVGRYVVPAALSLLLAAPVFAQSSAPSGSASRPSTMAPGGSAATPPSTGMQSPGTQSQGNLVDINSASAKELDALPGIGTARAEAIIANRPYRAKSDLAQRKIIPQNVYNQIQDRIVARQAGSNASGSSAPPAGASTRTK